MSQRKQTGGSSILRNPAASRSRIDETSPLLLSHHTRSAGNTVSINSRAKQSPEISIEDSDSLSFSSDALNVGRPRFSWRNILKRVPKGRAAFLVFVINFLETFAFYGALDAVRVAVIGDSSSKSAINWPYFVFIFLQFGVGRLLYPFAGILADVYLGRYRVIHLGLWLFWFGFAILSLSVSLLHYECKDPHLYPCADKYRIILKDALPIFSAVLFMLGSACIEANIIPFGVDQISQGASSDELSSYFSWYYFGRNAGYLAGIFTYLLLLDTGATFNQEITIQPMIALLIITIALLLHYCVQNWYYKDRQRENPLKSIFNILYYAATVKRQAPRYRRSFRYGEGKKKRIELAKIDFDGKYSSDEVEDVKTFFRVLFVILSLGAYYATYGAVFAMASYQYKVTSSKLLSNHHPFLPSNLWLICETAIIVLCIPILNHLILPYFPNASMKKRIGIGVLLNCLSIGVSTFLQWQSHNLNEKEKFLWLLLPTALFSIGDMLVVVSGLEFIYAQSPESMKGLLTGLFYFVVGIFSGAGSVFFYKFPIQQIDDFNTITWFYFLFTLVSVVGFGLYIFAWCLYKNRQRPTNDESEEEILRRNYADAVYSVKV